MNKDLVSENSENHLATRRDFLKTSALVAGSASLGPLTAVPAARAAEGDPIRIGLTGCGGRGTWIGELFQKHGGYTLAAVHDFFQDKADKAGAKLGVPENRRFTGLEGYRRMLESGLDAVAIESPPYFHPEQAALAVAAGKHAYLAKPIAVDVPGCTTIAETGRAATAKKLVVWVDFQTRAMPAYQEVVRRVHAGAIGPIKTAEAAYQCSLYFAGMDAEFRRSQRDATARLRAWAIDRVLSGDIITEQNIHALDVATWLLNAEPVKAVGTGGRAREYLGDCWDHFGVLFTFPGDVLLTFCSKQFGEVYDDIMCRVYGLTGSADTHYGGKVWVKSKDDGYSGETGTIGLEGPTRNIASFHEAIRKGDFSNPTVQPSVRSNLTTILGRTAAYKKAEVTWAQVMKANEKWEFDTRGLKT
jgi:predicted dehydrogenase